MNTKFKSIKHLCLLALAATDMAELAASAAPVLLVLLLRTVIRWQAELVKRLTAHLTVDHLGKTTINLKL